MFDQTTTIQCLKELSTKKQAALRQNMSLKPSAYSLGTENVAPVGAFKALSKKGTTLFTSIRDTQHEVQCKKMSASNADKYAPNEPNFATSQEILDERNKKEDNEATDSMRPRLFT